MAKHAKIEARTTRAREGSRSQELSRLVLAGFMGAGKSTVGPLLAKALGWRFLDLDIVIERRHNQTVPAIFREHGEAVFREREQQALASLDGEREIVLALGGGTLEHPKALPSLLADTGTCLVFLDAPLPELLARIQEKNTAESGSMKSEALLKEPGGSRESPRENRGAAAALVRPLLADPERLEARHRSRMAGYRAAHVTVVTTGLSPDEVAARILDRVRGRWRIVEKPAGGIRRPAREQ